MLRKKFARSGKNFFEGLLLDSSWGKAFSHEEMCFLMMKPASSWDNMLPYAELCFLMRTCFLTRKLASSQRWTFLKRKHVSLEGSTFPHEEACFLMRKHTSSYGTCFLKRKHDSSWGNVLPHNIGLFLKRKHVSSWECTFPHEEVPYLMRKFSS